MYKIDCKSEPKYVDNFTCKLNAISRQNISFNLDAYMKKNVSDIIVGLRLYRRYNTFKPFLIDFSFNMCKFMAKKTVFHNGFLPVVKMFLKNTNVNHSCPYDIVKVKNALFDPNLLPSAIPTGTYMVNLTFYEGHLSNFIGMLLLYFDIVEK